MNYTDDSVRIKAGFMGCKHNFEGITIYEGKMFSAFINDSTVANVFSVKMEWIEGV